MKDKINFQIKNLGPIHGANMDIRKITVVGGPNATGKSTASKLLYCFLRANFSGREDFALKQLEKKIDRIIGMVYDKLQIEEPEYVNFNELAPLEKPKSDPIVPYDTLELHHKFYQAQLDFYKNYSENNPFNESIKEDIKEVDDMLTMIHINENNELPISLLKNILPIEFDNLLSFNSSFNGMKNNEKFYFSIDLYNSNLFDDKSFVAEGQYDFNEVLYIDSISFLDTLHPPLNTTHHVGYLKDLFKKNHSENFDFFNEKINKTKLKIQSIISNIIGGEFNYDNGRLFYNSKNKDSLSIQNTSSGIKQIALLLYLLDNQILKEDCFLILDEPEVNLHPEWQFKYAEVLVLLAKELNINIYMNSHSPMFIEAIEVLTKYYELENDTTFYMAEKYDETSYNFINIDYDNLYELYDNLARPFDSIEVYRLKNEYKKGNY